jgi:uroporphyrinogen-III synthase
VVVSAEAVRAWQRREPQAWAKVSGWLAAHQVAVVAV